MIKKLALPLQKIARIHDRATGTFLERIEFPRYQNGKGQIDLSPSVICDPILLAKNLRDAGAVLPTDRGELRNLLEAIAAAPCKRQIIYAAKAGWLPNRKGFVTTSGVLGKKKSAIVGFRRSRPEDPRGSMELKGDVSGWKEGVGKTATASSIAMFAISAALAAPLLKVIGKPSFGFCLFAPTRSGKTFATAAAGSVMGIGRVENMLDWNQTDARFQEHLSEFNDMLTPIDDLKNMDGDNKSKHKRVAWLSYVIALGGGRGRHSSFKEPKNGRWRTIVLTSNEASLQQLANSARSERSGGETVRLIDVPAIFDECQNICDRGASINFKKAFPRLERNQGRILEAFLEETMPKEKGFRPRIVGYVKEFASQVRDSADGLIARDVADKFGLVYAAGRLGINYGLLPWKVADLRDAVAKCYFGARDLLPDDGVILRSGVQLLQQYLEALPEWKNVPRAASGFREDAQDQYRSLVKRDRFNEIFRSLEQRNLVVQWLISKKRVKLAKSNSGPPLIKEQHFWPDGNRHRSVEIFWPKAKLSPGK